MARAERRRRGDDGKCIIIINFAVEISSSVVDFGRDSLREGEARPQAGDALGKRLMFLFLSCKRKIPKKSPGRAPR